MAGILQMLCLHGTPTTTLQNAVVYGFRESDYFFLKIKAAFPGKARLSIFSERLIK
ncbi:hypothetical protein L3X16_12185 [Pseudomonas stutzeri]|nr:hypothetical protein [Stutzerimonas stutzeri]